jgi:3-hydroxybutyryl-CoA dehydratase
LCGSLRSAGNRGAGAAIIARFHHFPEASAIMAWIEGFTWDEIEIGQRGTFTRTISDEVVRLFAAASGDVNPLHLDEAYASGTDFKGRIAHGICTASLISSAIALVLPGPGVLYIAQELRFDRPVRIGDVITVELTVTEKLPEKRYVKMSSIARNQNGKTVITGVTTVRPAAKKERIELPAEPRVQFLP